MHNSYAWCMEFMYYDIDIAITITVYLVKI